MFSFVFTCLYGEPFLLIAKIYFLEFICNHKKRILMFRSNYWSRKKRRKPENFPKQLRRPFQDVRRLQRSWKPRAGCWSGARQPGTSRPGWWRSGEASSRRSERSLRALRGTLQHKADVLKKSRLMGDNETVFISLCNGLVGLIFDSLITIKISK